MRLRQKSPPKQRQVDFERPRPLLLRLSRDYMQIPRWTRISRVSFVTRHRWPSISRSHSRATNTTGNDVMPEVTTPKFWNPVTWFWTSSWPSISRSHSRAINSFREIGLPLSPVWKCDYGKNHPRNRGRSILSDHAHFCYVCHVIICKFEPLNKNIAVSLPGNQYYRKWRNAGSDHAQILKYCHVILNKQTPLTKYIAVSFACD